MKVIYLDKLYFGEIRKVKQMDIKGETVEFPENVFEVATGVANYAKIYYYADENTIYDLFIDKKDDKRVLIRVELNFFIGDDLKPLTDNIGKMVELFRERLPEVIAELKEEVKEEEPIVVDTVEEITNEQFEKLAKAAKKKEKK